MSNVVYPVLPGLAFSVTMTPVWQTARARSLSGKELRLAFMSYPLWQFVLTYEFLRANSTNEWQTLIDFYNSRQGGFDTFLFTNPDDNSVTNQLFGTGDGVTVSFQLTRPILSAGFGEPVQNVNGVPVIKVSGVTKTAGVDYNIGSTGIVAFTAAPAGAAPITWTGSFYYRCAFMDDSVDFEKFMNQLWTVKKVRFVSVKL